jgi:hypothetical protein
VVVDSGSSDLTPLILDRLAGTYQLLKVVHVAASCRPAVEGMAFCQGEVVYVLDLINRVSCADVIAAGSIIPGR